MADHKKTPGVFLVHCRLYEPSQENVDYFKKWTKLHYRDLTVVPTDPVYGGMTHCLRNIAPEIDSKYSHDATKPGTVPPYFYFCVLDDIKWLETQAYFDASRKLDIENTRSLVEGEEPVGKGGMVFDICDARFAVYEEVETGSKVPAYQTLPFKYTTPSSTSWTQPPESHIIGIHIKTPTGTPSDTFISLQSAVTDAYPASSAYKTYTSLYKFNKKAQPAHHPEIITDDNENWLLVVLLVKDGEGDLPARKDIEGKVDGLVKTWKEGKDLEPYFGVWDGEVWFGRSELF
ncbi:hypothetical protein BDV96DRAFT_597049 [Lophiotrema nucula]|uniref:EthD domain-containing protein n=1 Tax=Lophiotrema nucula TaxID=690887 RepID=A0A6A5ZG18_9PLEO|nr:hypothetical protein BDV96DRAFT_597049 [Lophiotrema nucula]